MTEKGASCVRVASFTWAKMKTAVLETAPQIALRICSKEVVGGRLIYVIW